MMNSEKHFNMTESYSEISNFLTATTNNSISDRNNSSNNGAIKGNENIGGTSSTSHSHNYKDENDFNDHDNEDEEDCSNGDGDIREKSATANNTQLKRPKSLACDKSFPYNLVGIVSKDGDMTHFVAENLEYKIKLSSPITKKDVYQSCSSKTSTPSTAAAAPPSSSLPSNFLCPQSTQIDSNVLNDIELEAQYLAASVDNLTENLCNLLHSVSSITADNIEIHKNAVIKLTDCMDANIKCMYTIMAKTEEISKAMKPIGQLAIRIREIKKLVEMLESNL